MKWTNKCTNKNPRIEKTWRKYTNEHYGMENLIGEDVSLKYLGGCQLYRPDAIYAENKYIMISECDEHGHNNNAVSYACEEKRISDIYNEEWIIGKKMIVVRWNPHSYKVPKGYVKYKLNEKLKMFVELLKYLQENPPTDIIHIYYMFYSHDSKLLSQNITHTMIYDTNDFS